MHSSRSSSNILRRYEPNQIVLPTAGIPFNQLVLPNGDILSLIKDILCGICKDIIWDIVECAKCGGFFCSYCINQSKSKCGNKCPLCRASPFISSQSKGVKKLFNNIRIKCDNQGCRETPLYSDYITHKKKCPFQIYHCTNKGCAQEDTLENIKHHSIECKYRIIRCQHCSEDIQEYQLINHVTNECLGHIECPRCFTSMTLSFYNSSHFNENNQNINCLQNQVDYYKNELKKSEEKNQKSLSDANKLKEVISKYEKEIKNLKDELSKWNDNFTNMYNNLMIKKDKRPEKEVENRTIENEEGNDSVECNPM